MLLHLGLLHLGPNVITFRTITFRTVITFRPSTNCHPSMFVFSTLLRTIVDVIDPPGTLRCRFFAMLCYYWTYRDSGMLLPVRLSCFKYASLGNTYLNFDLCEAHLLLREACPIWSLTYLFQKRFKKYSCWDKTMVVYYYDLNCNFNILNYFTNWYTRK